VGQCSAEEVTADLWGPMTNDVKMTIMVKPVVWTFSRNDITDLPKLVARLRGELDPVSAFVWHTLSPREQLLLANYQPSAPRSRECEGIVLEALNRIVEGPYFGDPEGFQGIFLRDETMGLMHRNVLGPDLAHLNRSILQDAYPVEVSRKLTVGDTNIHSIERVVIMVVLSNISTNETFYIRSTGTVNEPLFSFLVVSPSGNELSPEAPATNSRSKVNNPLGPNHSKQLVFDMSTICKCDEIGTYTITVKRIMWWPGGKQEWFTVISNPLSIKIVRDQ